MFGATAIGLVCKDAVVLAADKRVTYGSYVVSERGKKLFRVTPRIGAACAGLLADMRKAIDYLKVNLELYKAERRAETSVAAAANLLSLILFSRRLNPFYTQVLIAGVDKKGPQLYVLDPAGSSMPDKYAAIGSGTEIISGVLESEYKDNMSTNDCVKLVEKALEAAMKRDAITGGEFDIMVISPEGIKEFSKSLRS